jgi:hypothetical protein
VPPLADSTVSEDAGFELGTVATLTLVVKSSNRSAIDLINTPKKRDGRFYFWLERKLTHKTGILVSCCVPKKIFATRGYTLSLINCGRKFSPKEKLHEKCCNFHGGIAYISEKVHQILVSRDAVFRVLAMEKPEERATHIRLHFAYKI